MIERFQKACNNLRKVGSVGATALLVVGCTPPGEAGWGGSANYTEVVCTHAFPPGSAIIGNNGEIIGYTNEPVTETHSFTVGAGESPADPSTGINASVPGDSGFFAPEGVLPYAEAQGGCVATLHTEQITPQQ